MKNTKKIPELKCNLERAGQLLRLAREHYFSSLAVAQMEGSIRWAYEKLENHLLPTDAARHKTFILLTTILAAAWKKGYSAPREPLLSNLEQP
jgi:hypothetical protein